MTVRTGFHARDGWYFRRNDTDGSVTIEIAESAQADAELVDAATFDADTWASIVASVSGGDETAGTFGVAQALHAGGGMVTGPDFGAALVALRAGHRVAREEWNAPGQWVALSPGFELAADRVYSPPVAAEIGSGVGTFRPYLMLHAADGSFVPWAPTVSDVLADDWAVV